jgi:hypothetical protein
MARIESLLVVVLIALALLIGIVLGGSSIWYLKPSTGGEKVVEKAVNKYVCSDGAIKDAQNQCPILAVSSDGKQTVSCPVCPAKTTCATLPSSGPSEKFDCYQCVTNCNGIILLSTTTTLVPLPVCKACTTNTDCGSSGYSDMRCKNDEAYKMLIEPFCDIDNKTKESCCKAKETYNKIMTCPAGQRCYKGKGCEAYEDAVARD